MTRVTVGRVIKPHGIRGEVVVDPTTDLPERFAPGASLHVGQLATTVRASRPHQGRLLVTFEGVPDRTTAERLRGRTVEAEPLEVEEQSHYFVHELVDLPVVAEDDSLLGHVVALVELPEAAGYDLLEVERADGSTWWLPAADALVMIEQQEREGQTPPDDGGPQLQLRVIDPPVGLIDDEPDVVPPTDGDDGSV